MLLQKQGLLMPNKNIQTIHILKNKLGLSDDIYRAILHENFKTVSSKDLTLKQQSQLISLLSQELNHSLKGDSSYRQHNYILFLSKDIISDLSAFCSKILNRSINQIQELSKSEAIKIINTLKRYEPRTVKHSKEHGVLEQCHREV